MPLHIQSLVLLYTQYLNREMASVCTSFSYSSLKTDPYYYFFCNITDVVIILYLVHQGGNGVRLKWG